ncbi:MAG: amidohydrolase family protein [Candidatus Marinimicrobia bacterium]|nr:amidohydrolase family protein [Candidatus Neomarinimicrobiota bacterium]
MEHFDSKTILHYRPNLGLVVRAIIALLLTLSIDGCERGRAPDTVFTGGDIWTGVPGAPRAQALAVRHGELLMVGSDQEVLALKGHGTEVVPLKGRPVVPGFIDNHTHFIPGGRQLASVNLRNAASRDDFARRVALFARGLPAGRWITGGDWDHELWGGALPHRAWIDEVTGDNPVFISRLDGHMALANSLALELDGGAPQPTGGDLCRCNPPHYRWTEPGRLGAGGKDHGGRGVTMLYGQQRLCRIFRAAKRHIGSGQAGRLRGPIPGPVHHRPGGNSVG